MAKKKVKVKKVIKFTPLEQMKACGRIPTAPAGKRMKNKKKYNRKKEKEVKE